MRREGSARPDAVSAARTRSRASDTALSGSPTTVNAGKPGATCTCTVTLRASMPSNATVATRWTIRPPEQETTQARRNPDQRQEHLQNTANRLSCCSEQQKDYRGGDKWLIWKDFG